MNPDINNKIRNNNFILLPFLKKTWQKILFQFLILTFISLFFFIQDIWTNYSLCNPINFWDAFLYQFTIYYTWGLLLPLVIVIASRINFERRQWYKILLVHTAAAFIIGLIHKYISLDVFYYFCISEKYIGQFPIIPAHKLIYGSFNNFIIYWIIIGIYYGLKYYHQNRQNKLLAAQLEQQLTQAQLQSLKMQLHPHFLFNSLNSISSLMDEDIPAARKMLTRLGDLLRHSLDSISDQEVELKQEIEFLERYLDIELIRFQDRMKINFKIDPGTWSAKVPNLILQPLVENAIKHGIFPKAEGGCIEIISSRKNNHLLLEVNDDGVGAKTINEGLGISNTRKRLQQLYGSQQQLEIQNGSSNGLSVKITLPFCKIDN